MSRPFPIFVLVLAVLVAGVVFYQHRLYRTPVPVPEQSGRTMVTSAQPDAIPPIIEPDVESVGAADQYLNNAGYGLMVQVGSRVRFYPFQILVWHEVVHDEVNGVPLLVSFDPLTYTSDVYERASEEVFDVSGKKWNSNSVLIDQATGSLWSQMMGRSEEHTSELQSR